MFDEILSPFNALHAAYNRSTTVMCGDRFIHGKSSSDLSRRLLSLKCSPGRR